MLPNPKRYFPKIPRGFKGLKVDPETSAKRFHDAVIADILSKRNQPKSASELDHENYMLRIVQRAQKAWANKARTRRAERRAEERTRKAEEKKEFIQKESEDRMTNPEEEELAEVQIERAELRMIEAEHEIKMAEYQKQRAEEKMKKAEDKRLRAKEKLRNCEETDFTEVQNLEDKNREANIDVLKLKRKEAAQGRAKWNMIKAEIEFKDAVKQRQRAHERKLRAEDQKLRAEDQKLRAEERMRIGEEIDFAEVQNLEDKRRKANIEILKLRDRKRKAKDRMQKAEDRRQKAKITEVRKQPATQDR